MQGNGTFGVSRILHQLINSQSRILSLSIVRLQALIDVSVLLYCKKHWQGAHRQSTSCNVFCFIAGEVEVPFGDGDGARDPHAARRAGARGGGGGPRA